MFQEQGQRVKIKMVHVSDFSFKEPSWNPHPVTPSYWLNCVTWSTLAARESGRLGALSWAHCHPEQNLTYGCLFATIAFRFNLPSFTSYCHIAVLPHHFPVFSHPSPSPTKCYNVPREPGSTTVCCLFLSKTSISSEMCLKQQAMKVMISAIKRLCSPWIFFQFPFQLHGPIVLINNNLQHFSIQTPRPGNPEVVQNPFA